MSFRKLLKMVDNRSKDSVFGYIRQSGDTSEHTAIPMMIQYCCLKYYFVTEYFSKIKCGNLLKVNNDPRIVIRTGDNHLSANSVFGNIAIDLNNNSIKKYVWKFKIISMTGTMYIGIDSLDYKTEINRAFSSIAYHKCNKPFYAFGFAGCVAIYHSKRDNYFEASGTSSVDGDIITMELNAEKRTLRFYRDDVDLGIIRNIRLEKYWMAVSIFSKDTSIQLLKYQEICQ